MGTTTAPQPSTIEEALDLALNSAFGISLDAGTEEQAKALRRKIYALRNKARRHGDLRYDHLSALVRENGELWIIPRPEGRANPSCPYPVRPLGWSDVPQVVRARGVAKTSFINILLHYMDDIRPR